MTRTDPLALNIRDDSRICSDLRLVVLVRSWPSLGITRDDPQFGLRRSMSRKTIATGRKADLVAWAAKRHHNVTDATN